MRSKKACLGILMSVVLMGAFTLVGCSKDDDDDPAPATSTTKTLQLSAGFTSNCAGCHGSSGQGVGEYPNLQDFDDGETAFAAVVRGGKGKMGAFNTTVYSDADLKADFAKLTN